jgi:ASC-1-like (ASCH) protein
MQHVAIMRKSWGFIPKIELGEKIIESRWYKVRYAPWRRIQPGETIYFKNSGEPVTLAAEVKKVLYFSDLTPQKVLEILQKYGKDDGIEEEQIPEFFERFKHKRYSILIYLKNAHRVAPFEINKQEFGAMASWICVDDINRIKR